MSDDKPRDRLDGYSPLDMEPKEWDVLQDPEAIAQAMMQAQNDAADAVESGKIHFDALEGYKQELMDAFRNFTTGIGDPVQDKSMHNDFILRLLSGTQAQDRWRGSDVGGRIIEIKPSCMTREGWQLAIQPTRGGNMTLLDAPPTTVTPPPIQALPESSDDATAVIEAMEQIDEEHELQEAFRLALCYKRCYGGGAVFLGVDDGNRPLNTPLDISKVRKLNHLSVFRGGWDGEVIAWRYYRDLVGPKFGKPEVFMLRNIGVPIGAAPAPGERVFPEIMASPSGVGPTTAYIHESRFLLFPGQITSNWQRVAMRGWGDSIFVRIDEVLAQYGLTWQGVATLLSEFSVPVLKMTGLAASLAAKDKKEQGLFQARAAALAMAMSICKARLIDKEEELTRLTVPLSGMADVLEGLNLRVAAAAELPLSMLMGQVQGGLGDASKGDIRFFYDQARGEQATQMLPQLRKYYKIQFASKEGPTKGKIPRRCGVLLNPLWQMNDAEQAKVRLDVAGADNIYLKWGVYSSGEVAATRSGGKDYNGGPIMLDIEGRKKLKALDLTVGKRTPPKPEGEGGDE